ncbi:hypothetical protein ACQBAT_10525 [Ornithinimicrobium sp. Y1847]|uniref:hypothetical protein n=1 Tax=unclassified Ornithinimicrobium TaxID=2615080 RepID=UPI003B66CFC7
MTSGNVGDQGQHAAQDRSAGLVVATMAGALVIFGVMLAVLGAELATPEAWMLAAVAVFTLLSWGLVRFLPPPPGAPQAGAVMPLVVLRAAILEAPAMIGIGLAFAADPPNLLVYLLPAMFALAGLWMFARPSVVRSHLDKARAR